MSDCSWCCTGLFHWSSDNLWHVRGCRFVWVIRSGEVDGDEQEYDSKGCGISLVWQPGSTH